MTTEWPTKRIRVDLIDPNKWNPNVMTAEAIGKLKRVVEDEGLGILAHISVRPKGKRYELLDGEHRLAVYKDLGLEEVDAVVADLDDDHARMAGLILNELRGQPQLGLLSAELKGLAERHTMEDLATVLPWRENVLRRLAEAYKGTEQDDGIIHGPGPLRVAILLEDEDYEALLAWSDERGIHRVEEAVIAAMREGLSRPDETDQEFVDE